jgi:hypothetical protein
MVRSMPAWREGAPWRSVDSKGQGSPAHEARWREGRSRAHGGRGARGLLWRVKRQGARPPPRGAATRGIGGQEGAGAAGILGAR